MQVRYSPEFYPSGELLLSLPMNRFRTKDPRGFRRHRLVPIFSLERYENDLEDPLFPEGCNVNFYEKKGEALVNLRTFERGVEGETLSCGTGATATAIALSKRYGWENQVDVVMRGGDLTIEFTKEYKDVFLCGEVKKILSCSYEIK